MAVAENVLKEGLGIQDECLTAPQTCEVLKISRTKLYELIAGDPPKLRSVRIGSSRRILASDLRAYMGSLGE